MVLDLTGAGGSFGRDCSEALHTGFPSLAGEMYLSRLARGRSMAVFERSIGRRLKAGPAIDLERLPELGAILDELSIALNDDLR